METVVNEVISIDDLFGPEEPNSTSIVTSENKDESYSLWIHYGGHYSPAVNFQTEKELPSGIYRWVEDREGVHVVPTTIQTDELYTFSESFTDKIIKEVRDFWNKKDVYKKYNIVHKRGLLLEGKAGNGKSAAISLLIKDLLENKGVVFLVTCIKEFQIFYENIQSSFKKIEPERPVITIIEDVDKLVASMGTDAPLLDLLDGKNSIDHHLVIMTSNDTTDLSDALLRPSRVDLRYVVDVPSDKIRREFFMKKGVTDNLDYLVDKTRGMTFAQMKEVFIGTSVIGKDIDSVVNQILNPVESKDYLTQNKQRISL